VDPIIIPLESAAIAIGAAIGGVLKGAINDTGLLERFVELASCPEVPDLIEEYTSLSERLDIPSEPNKSTGFVYVGNDTWLPKAIYDARKRQQRKMARESSRTVVWTR
jgi:hypothetical protein